MKTAPILIMLVILLLLGCAQAGDNQSSQPIDDNATSKENLPMSDTSLSSADQTALFTAVAQQQNLPIDQLTITEAKKADWPDACLGLAGPDEFCAQIITPGWAISITDGQQSWNYRTNLEMSQVKLAPKK